MKTKSKITIGIGIGIILVAIAAFTGGSNLFKGSFTQNFRQALTHKVSPSYLILNSTKPEVTITYTANQPLDNGLYLYIADASKNKVKKLLDVRDRLPQGTSNSITWDGKGEDEKFVSPGSYNYIFLAGTTTTLGIGKIDVKQLRGGIIK